MPLVDEIVAMEEELVRWRRDIHAHPELGFEETRTSAFVADKLEEFGIQVTRNVGKTGVVGVLIPASARLSGTARTLSTNLMAKIETAVEARSKNIARAHGTEATVDFRTIFHPVVNDVHATGVAAEVCGTLVGGNNVIGSQAPGTGSEDFSFMSEKVPSCYLLVGNGENSNPLHNPDYDFNDQALVYGASFFARVVEHTLKPE